jgi:hypothetical protein
MISDFDDQYEPTSTPKLPPSRPIRCFIKEPIGKLPERVSKLLKGDTSKYISPVYPPIVHIDGYIHSMGLTDEKEELCRKMYTPESIEVVVKEEKFKPKSYDYLYVYSTMNVLKSGLVRIKFTVPMEPLYESQKKGKDAQIAPLDVRIRCMKAVGYPDSVLTDMIKHHDYMKTKQVKLDEFINLIFGKSVNAKVSKPKTKTTQEALNAKLKKKPTKKW